MGIDINNWLINIQLDLRKVLRFKKQPKNCTTIERFCTILTCPLCLEQINGTSPICSNCILSGGKKESAYELIKRKKAYENIIQKCNHTCAQCIGQMGISCSGCFCISCEVYWKKQLAEEFFDIYSSYQEIFNK